MELEQHGNIKAEYGKELLTNYQGKRVLRFYSNFLSPCHIGHYGHIGKNSRPKDDNYTFCVTHFV